MQEFYRKKLVPYPAEQMFALVSDVNDYPLFLPLCRDAEVLHSEEGLQIARLEVGKGALQWGWTTRNQLLEASKITMQLEEGPFTSLEGAWSFQPLDEAASVISLALRYRLSDSLLSRLQQQLFTHLVQSIINAFTERAAVRYGSDSTGNNNYGGSGVCAFRSSGAH